MLALALTVVFLTTAAVLDLRSRRIPDWIPLALLGAGVVLVVARLDAVPWVHRALGICVGFAIGAMLFYGRVLGGGDAKLMAGMGACLGLPILMVVFLFSSIVGGAFAYWARRRGEREVAYAPALALGTCVFWIVTFVEGRHGLPS